MSSTTPTPQTVEGNEQTPALETVEQRYQRLYNAEHNPPPTPQAPAPVAIDPAILETINSLKEELSSVKQLVTPKPVEPPPTTLTPWFERLRQGDWEGAEKDLEDRIRAKVLAEAKTAASSESFEAMKVQMEIKDFMRDLRGQNPDIAPMERYLEAPVARRIEALQQQGKIKTADDFIREYKDAVSKEVEEIRKITGQYRASGAQAAAVRQREVLSATPLSPQSVSLRQDSQSPVEPQGESIEDYFARRKTLESMRKRMAF